MNSNSISNGILKALAIILGIGLLLFFLYQIQSVIVYVAIAAVISLIGRPIVLFLQKRLKFKNTIAVIVTMVVLVGLFIGLVSLFIPLVVEQGHNLSLLNIDMKSPSFYFKMVELKKVLKRIELTPNHQKLQAELNELETLLPTVFGISPF